MRTVYFAMFAFSFLDFWDLGSARRRQRIVSMTRYRLKRRKPAKSHRHWVTTDGRALENTKPTNYQQEESWASACASSTATGGVSSPSPRKPRGSHTSPWPARSADGQGSNLTQGSQAVDTDNQLIIDILDEWKFRLGDIYVSFNQV